MKTIQTLLACMWLLATAQAADYYCSPTGNNANDGLTTDTPWASLASVAAAKTLQPGDRLLLMSGYHGSPNLSQSNAGTVYVLPAGGASPTVGRLTISGDRWHVSGLSVSPSHGDTTYGLQAMVRTTVGASYNTITNCNIFTTTDDVDLWGISDWKNNARDGVSISGDNNTVSHCTVSVVNCGITVQRDSPFSTVSHNTITKVWQDHMRCISSDAVFEYNFGSDSYIVETVQVHPDFFQAWSVGPAPDYTPGGGTISRVIVRGNVFVARTNPNQPFSGSAGYPQGIGCFDGMAEDWIVENNVIFNFGWHGISIFGGINCKIINNTVVDLDTATTGAPWIHTRNHKDGTPATGNIVRNNIAASYDLRAGTVAAATNNITSTAYSSLFVDWAGFDARLKAGAAAIDAGTALDAPVIDADGNARPAGAAHDIGAYEYGTAAADTTPPVISAISSGTPTSTTATITWTTDEGATSRVDYGTTTGYGSNLTSSSYVTSHSVHLSGLTASTTYHFKVTSVDGATNSAESADQTFTTAAASLDPATAPEFSPNGAISLDAVNVTIAKANGGDIKYSLVSDAGPWTTYSSPLLISDQGVTAIWAYVDAGSGFAASPVATRSFTIGASEVFDTWTEVGIGPYSVPFVVEWDQTYTAANMDAVVAVGPTSGVDAFVDNSCLIRSSSTGLLQALNGGALYQPATGTTYPTPINTTIRFRMVVTPSTGAQVSGVTAAASTDVLTKTAHGYVDGQYIAFVSGTGFGGLLGARGYYVRDVTTDTLKLASTRGGSAVNITSDGTDGVFQTTGTYDVFFRESGEAEVQLGDDFEFRPEQAGATTLATFAFRKTVANETSIISNVSHYLLAPPVRATASPRAMMLMP